MGLNLTLVVRGSPADNATAGAFTGWQPLMAAGIGVI